MTVGMKAACRLVGLLSPLMSHVAVPESACQWMAEDAVQLAWVRLFRSLDGFDPRISVSSWAVMIVKGVLEHVCAASPTTSGDGVGRSNRGHGPNS